MSIFKSLPPSKQSPDKDQRNDKFFKNKLETRRRRTKAARKVNKIRRMYYQ